MLYYAKTAPIHGVLVIQQSIEDHPSATMRLAVPREPASFRARLQALHQKSSQRCRVAY